MRDYYSTKNNSDIEVLNQMIKDNKLNYIDNLVGKCVIRTQPIIDQDGRADYSFTTNPIMIKGVDKDHIFYNYLNIDNASGILCKAQFADLFWKEYTGKYDKKVRVIIVESKEQMENLISILGSNGYKVWSNRMDKSPLKAYDVKYYVYYEV